MEILADEGFACGTPAAVRVPGGNRKTVDTSDAGFACEDEACLFAVSQKLSITPGLGDKLGQEARRADEECVIEVRHFSRYLKLVEAVLSKNGRAAELRGSDEDNNSRATII